MTLKTLGSLVLLFALTALPFAARAQDDRAADREAIRAHIDSIFQAFIKKDAAALRVELAVVFSQRAAAEWEEVLMAAGVPAGRVRTIPEAVAEPQTAARGLLQKVFSSELGLHLVVPGAAFKLNGSAPHPSAAPRPVGADSVVTGFTCG